MGLYIGETSIGKVIVGSSVESNIFVITLSWDDDYFGENEGAWVPNYTFAEIQTAYQAGKTLVVDGDWYNTNGTADGIFQNDSMYYIYCVNWIDNNKSFSCIYTMSESGIEIDEDTTFIYPNFSTPSVAYTPTESQQNYTITPGSGYNGIEEVDVTINAVPSNYVGSSINRRSSTDLTASGATVTAPAGFYSAAASKAVASGTVTAPSSISGTAATVSTGTNTLTLTKTVSVTPDVTTAGYVSSGTAGNSSVSLTASVNTRSSSDLTVSDATVTVPSGYYGSNASKSVASGSVTAPSTISGTSATVSTGTNTLTLSKTVSVTPTVSTAGYVSSGTAGNSSVSLTASVTTKGAATITPTGSQQTISSGTYLTGAQTIQAVTTSNLTAENIKNGVTVKVGTSTDDDSVTSVTGTYEGSGSGGGGMNVATATATPSTASSSISFTGLSGEPTSFYVVSASDLATGASPYKTAAVVFDGTDVIGSYITNTNNAQVSFSDTAFSKTYSNGTLTITGSGTNFQANQYKLVYTYGGSSSNIGTADVQVGSGATSITFTGLSDEPSCFSCLFKSNFSTSSGYTRTIVVVHDGTSTYGMEMGSGAEATTNWSYTYNNGSLTISSQSTSAGGYFHQPGYYQLTYGVGGEISIEVEPLTVTQNGTYAESGKAYSPVVVNVSGGGGKAIQVNSSAGSVRTTSYSSTGVSITVAKAGTYNVSWMGWKSSSSGTMGTNLYKNGNAGTNQTAWTNNYGQHITLTNQTYAAGDVLTLYAVSSNTSRYCGAGNLIIEEQ